MDSDQNVIRVSNLKKAYGDLQAVNGISFSVNRGEIFGLLGPNGAGKTTTLGIIEGLLQADAGTVHVLGHDGNQNQADIKQQIGVQLQKTSLLPDLSVVEQIILFSPAALYFLAVGVNLLLGGTAPQFPMLRENQHMILMVFIMFLLPWQSSAFLEEVGFRGYALEELQNKYGPMLGTLILGVFFGGWLLPEFFNTDSLQFAMGGISFFPWFILTEIGWSVLMTWIYNRTGKSSLIAGYLFHTAFNTWALVLLTNAIPGEPIPALDVNLQILTAIVVTLAGVVIAIATKGKLGYQSENAD